MSEIIKNDKKIQILTHNPSLPNNSALEYPNELLGEPQEYELISEE